MRWVALHSVGGMKWTAGAGPAPAPTQINQGNLSLPSPLVSFIEEGKAGSHPSRKGESILRAITAPLASSATRPLTARERILRALTDDAYA